MPEDPLRERGIGSQREMMTAKIYGETPRPLAGRQDGLYIAPGVFEYAA